jgi:NADP-dependent 3-hydroxy acid dehydrogenase YdfG
MQLTGKTALITGASGGIGKAVADALNVQGMSLLLTDKVEDKLKEQAAGYKRASYLATDILDPKAPQALVDKAVADFGSLHVVFSNAGSMLTGPIETIDIEKVCEMVRLDIEAPFRLAYTVLRHFKRQNSGYLLHTSSIAGLKTAPRIGAYCGAKFAIEALTDSLRMELAGTGVSVGCIEPGTVDTGLYAQWTDEQKGTMFRGGALPPEDIARCVVFMLEQPDSMRIPRLLAVPAGQPG